MSMNSTSWLVLAQQMPSGPQGPEFGKAAPIGLLVIVVLLVAVVFLAYSANRHYRNVRERVAIAEEYGLDPFDNEAIERIRAERSVYPKEDSALSGRRRRRRTSDADEVDESNSTPA